MLDEVVLSNEQIALGCYISAQIEKCGSALVDSAEVRCAFGVNLDAMKWMVFSNNWDLRYDGLLDLTSFWERNTTAKKSFPIAKLRRTVNSMRKKGMQEISL